MTRTELIGRTRRLVVEGERLAANPSLPGLQVWLQLSDDLLSAAWGTMDRYHLSWAQGGGEAPRRYLVGGRPMTPEEEAAYVREVAEQKTAALRMSLDAVERQGMPFVGEDAGGGDGPTLARRQRAPPMSLPATVPAVGRQRRVPTPDPIARDYGFGPPDQRIPGLVDAYFGPADLKVQVDIEPHRASAALVADAADLLGRLDGEVTDPARRAWLQSQLLALETHARVLAGEQPAYLELVRRCFDAEPIRRGDAAFRTVAGEVDRLLPGSGDVRDRLAEWDAGMVVPIDRLRGIVDWLVGVVRERSIALFGVPDGEALRVALVSGQPWSGYNWYDGGRRSRVDINTDLPIRVSDLIGLVSHETYPGHHLEHTWHEAVRIDQRGELEASVLLINTPECLISEGLAEVGRRFAVAPAGETDLVAELLDRAGIMPGSDAAPRRALAEQAVGLRIARAGLGAAAVDAALMLHVDGLDRAVVRSWLELVALMTPERAEKRLEFIEHPLWRTYVFVYAEGAALLERWLAAVPNEATPARFRRLLVEPITPSSIEAELASG